MTATGTKWAEARTAFLAGESAVSIAARLDLPLPGLRRRISRQGWVELRDMGQPIGGGKIRRVSRELSTLSQRLAVLSEVVSASTT